MTVHQIMTRKVVSCHKDTTLAAAAKQMLDGRCGTLPVVDVNGKLAGIITDRDIAMTAAIRLRKATEIPVRDAMNVDVRSCFADDTVGAALTQMEEACVRRLPVVDHAGRLAGIVSIDDIVLRALHQPGGISAFRFVNAFRRICARRGLVSDSDEAYVNE